MTTQLLQKPLDHDSVIARSSAWYDKINEAIHEAVN